MSKLESNRSLVALGLAALLSACSPAPHAAGVLPWQGARYVAMGSSYAAGLGIAGPADQVPNRCGRSSNNYAHILALKLGLQLTDVSCSGATTSEVIGPWHELGAQMDALTSDTKLVTITIGGNDVGYIGRLGALSCHTFAVPPLGTPGGKCPAIPTAVADWSALKAAMLNIAWEVHRRSPEATLFFVDYLTILPERDVCEKTPLPPGKVDAIRAVATRLAELTKIAAAQTGSELLSASAMSRKHGACSEVPWVTGFPLPGQRGFIPYHPNQAGMSAIASDLAARLRTKAGR